MPHRILSIPRPWAGAAVCGFAELVNVPKRIRLPGVWWIHANRQKDDVRMCDPMDELAGHIIGSVRVLRCEHASDVQLRGARQPGRPWVLLLVPGGGEVLEKPRFVRSCRPFQIDKLEDVDVGPTVPAREWLERRSREAFHRGMMAASERGTARE